MLFGGRVLSFLFLATSGAGAIAAVSGFLIARARYGVTTTAAAGKEGHDRRPDASAPLALHVS